MPRPTNALLDSFGTLRPHQPSLRERGVNALRQALFSDDRAGQQQANRLMDYVDYTPVGAAVDAYDIMAEEGMQGAPLAVAMAGIPGPARRGIRAFKGMHPFNAAGDVTDLTKGRGQQDWVSKSPHAGFYASNPDVASHFAEQLTKQGAVFPVDLDFKKPLIIDGGGRKAAHFQFGDAADEWNSYFTSPEYADYDGVILQNVEDAPGVITDIYVPKSSGQIRHAFAKPGPAKRGFAGLAMDVKSRMERAAAQGWDMDAYHGTSTPDDFTAFDKSRVRDNIQYGGNFYFSPTPDFANKSASSWRGGHDRVMPVKLKMKNPFRMDQPIQADDAAKIMDALGQHERASTIRGGRPYRNGSELFYFGLGHDLSAQQKAEAIRAAGFDGIIGDPAREITGTPGRPHIMVYEPNQIRSRFAAFDPSKADSADLLD